MLILFLISSCAHANPQPTIKEQLREECIKDCPDLTAEVSECESERLKLIAENQKLKNKIDYLRKFVVKVLHKKVVNHEDL